MQVPSRREQQRPVQLLLVGAAAVAGTVALALLWRRQAAGKRAARDEVEDFAHVPSTSPAGRAESNAGDSLTGHPSTTTIATVPSTRRGASQQSGGGSARYDRAFGVVVQSVAGSPAASPPNRALLDHDDNDNDLADDSGSGDQLPQSPTTAMSRASSLTMRRAGSTAREDALNMALEAAAAFDETEDDEDPEPRAPRTADEIAAVRELQHEAYCNALEMDEECALAWYKLGTFGTPAVLRFRLMASAKAEPSDIHHTRNATTGRTETLVAPLECTRRAVDLVLSCPADDKARRAQLLQGWSLADGFFNLAMDGRRRVENPAAFAPNSALTKTTIAVGADDISWIEALRRALELDPADCSKWIEAAQALDDDDGTDGSNPRRIAISGFGKLSARDMYLRVATGRIAPGEDGGRPVKPLPPSSTRQFAWESLGVSLSALSAAEPTFRVDASDTPATNLIDALKSRPVTEALQRFKWPRAVEGAMTWTARECLQAAAALEPLVAHVWIDLAKNVLDHADTSQDAEESFDGSGLSPLECLAAALDIDPDNADTWTLLTSCLEAGMARERPNIQVLGRPLSSWRPLDCLVQAVQRDASRAESWYNVALASPAHGASIAAKGATTARPYSAVECLAEAVRLEPEWAAAWLRLGLALLLTNGGAGAVHSGVSVRVGEQRVDAREALRRAAELNPSSRDAWGGLASVMKDLDAVVIRGVPYSREQCAAKHDECRAADGDDDDADDEEIDMKAGAGAPSVQGHNTEVENFTSAPRSL